MNKQVAVFGMGRFGVSVATTLASMGHDVLAVDRDEERVESLATQLPHVIQADATSEPALRELEVNKFDVAIVAMGSDIEASVMTTVLLKQLGVKRIISRANDKLHGGILERIGADDVIYPEGEMGVRVAHRMTLHDVSDYMSIVDRYGIARLDAPADFNGQKLSALGFGPGSRSEVAVLLIQRQKEVIISPGLDETIYDGDVLMLAGNDEQIERMLNQAKRNSKNNNNNNSH